MVPVEAKTTRQLLLISPLAVIAVTYVIARVTGLGKGPWTWLPSLAVYWAALGLLVATGAGRASLRRWLRARAWSWGWAGLALVVGLLPLTIFLTSREVLRSLPVLMAWLTFALLNPWFEETYWRGLLTDATAGWPGWLRVLYPSVLFAANHPLALGAIAAMRDPAVTVATFVMGVAWSATYLRTGSLWYPIASHVLVDLFNLAVPVLMGLYVPPGLAGASG